MPGVPDPGVKIWEASGLSELPPSARALFGQDVFSTEGWYGATIAHALPAGTRPAFAVAQTAGGVVAIFPMQRGPHGLGALTTPYTCLWQPLLRSDVDPQTLFRIGRAFGRYCRGSPTTRLDAMDADAPFLAPFLSGVRGAGLRALRFHHFGNWHVPTGGLTWSGFLAARPGALRESVRRRGKRWSSGKGATFRVIDSPDGIEPAIAAYEAIYSASWKEPEPFPDFAGAFIRASAADGSLRLGLLELDGAPIAAQVWVVWDSWACVLKLAHDERLRALSPGTVLTALMIQLLLEQDGVQELDFGRGDDEYKKLWTGERRQRIGVMLANPLSPGGAAAIIRHGIGALRRKSG